MKNIKNSFVFDKLKDVYSPFFHQGRLIIGLFVKKIHELDPFLIHSSHGFYVLEVKGVLNFPSINGRLVQSHTTHHVRISGSEPVRHGVVESGMIPINAAPRVVISITRAGGRICSNFDSLVFGFLKVHLFGPIASRRVGLSNPICSVAKICIRLILQI